MLSHRAANLAGIRSGFWGFVWLFLWYLYVSGSLKREAHSELDSALHNLGYKKLTISQVCILSWERQGDHITMAALKYKFQLC